MLNAKQMNDLNETVIDIEHVVVISKRQYMRDDNYFLDVIINIGIEGRMINLRYDDIAWRDKDFNLIKDIMNLLVY